MANVNSIAPMRACDNGNCSIPATLEGLVPNGTFQFCDRIIGDDASDKLKFAIDNFKAKAQPFFMAVGFRRPHLPFRHPQPWDQFYADIPDTPLAEHLTMDLSVPPIAHHDSGLSEGRSPYVAIPDKRARQLRHDYYAAISWMDWNMGRVLSILDSDPEVANQTIVVFHADHGFSLGEHGQWEKFTNWEHGTRVPLIVRMPGEKKSQGQVTSSIVELVDMYPTVAELAGNPVPPSYKLEGQSFAALLYDPTTVLPKNTSLSVFPRCPANVQNTSLYWQSNDCNMHERTQFFSMGVTLREDQWRYTEWLPWDSQALQPLFNATPIGVELYTHADDSEASFDGPWEQVNLAGDSQYAATQARLAKLLRQRYNNNNVEVSYS